jgi:hypothetical protein
MSSAKESFRLLLKKQGHSGTGARLAVFEALIGSENRLGMHTLVAAGARHRPGQRVSGR